MAATPRHCSPASRKGFTLTELLVATALTVIVMLLFAQIYASAVSSVKKQRGLARNDQSARSITNVIRTDLQNMTTRQPGVGYGTVRGIVPLSSGDEVILDPYRQRGYFYVSENDPELDTDDVLQFTMQINNLQRSDFARKNQQLLYTGRVANLGVTNQPDADDGVIGNGLGVSRAAEVSYFLRAGNLYRRVQLLRDPLAHVPARPDQPSSAAGAPLFHLGARQFLSADSRASFSNEFDCVALPIRSPAASGSGKDLVLTFLGINSLANDQRATNYPLGLPHFRFGHDSIGALPNTGPMGTGRPREFDSNNQFFGRLTLDELTKVVDETPTGTAPLPYQDTANDYPAVAYPGAFLTGTHPNVANPYSVGNVLRDLDGDGSLDLFGTAPDIGAGQDISKNGGRVGEDILLANVEGFDIQVFDPLLDSDSNATAGPGGYTNLGHGATFGAYRITNNATYQTGSSFANIYDTWHPSANSAADLGTAADGYQLCGAPPFRPVLQPTVVAWSAATGLGAVIPAVTSNALVYQWVSGTTKGTFQPEFPPVVGHVVHDGDVTWQCVENRIGLQAIRIVIRYRDNGNGTPRQVSIVHSFVE